MFQQRKRELVDMKEEAMRKYYKGLEKIPHPQRVLDENGHWRGDEEYSNLEEKAVAEEMKDEIFRQHTEDHREMAGEYAI